MKNIKLSLVLGISVLALASSCKKMDLYPYSSIERSQSFLTVKDAGYWDTGIHSYIKGRSGGLYQHSQDIQADQLNASVDYGNRNGSPHRMNDSFNSDDYTIRDVWNGYYTGITNANVAIDGYQKIEGANAAQTDSLAKYLGGAQIARAHYYTQLMLRYAKAYTPGSASTDLGVPLVLEFDPNLKPPRATSKAVYDQVLADLTAAKTNLAKVPGKQGASRFTIDVAVALEARARLYTQDWAGAYAAAKSLIDGGKYPLYTTADGIKSMWHSDTRQEDIMQLHGTVANNFSTVGGNYLGYNAGANLFAPDFIPTQSIIDLFPAGDYRKPVFFEPKVVQLGGTKYENTLQLVIKFQGNPALFSGATTNYAHYIKFARIGEQYLIAAEAAYMNGGDEVNARKYLNDLRVARGLPATNATGAALLAEIKAERTRELAFEGFRLFDIKRWGEGIKRGNPQNVNPLMNAPASDYTQLDKPASFGKIVWGIPTNDMIINPSLAGQQNPGW
ncbi:MAG: RagB/SusD family nutrient uptake outer membrane protein [Pedobacter sp.]|nr:MAG: RagB/SusD family nutrient uptake outer membrane protein [Pedobacter sp.]